MLALTPTALILPYCWICQKRFKTSVPPGPAVRNDHHIVPRNAGGTDGPQVSLCDTHHSTVHRLAERLHSNKAYTELLFGEDDLSSKKLLWLATTCYRAELAVVGDPNKHLGVSISLSTEEVQVMDALRVRYGNISRKNLVLLGMRLLAKNLQT